MQTPRPANVARANRSLRIAIVYSRPPLPMTRADQKTVAHLIEFLAARGHEVDLFTLAADERLSEAAAQWLTQRCRHVSVVAKSRLRSLVDSMISASKGDPLQIGYFWSRRQAQSLAESIRTRRYDVIYVYYIRSAPVYRAALQLAGPDTFKGISVLGMQLSQALNTRRMIEKMRRRSDRAIYGIESRNLRRFEAQVWKEFTRVVLIGEKDVEELRQVCRESGQPEPDNVFLCAHGVDIEEFRPDPASAELANTLVFSGVMRTNTNIHAITWFSREVWPHVRASVPDAQLLVVGRQPTSEVRALESLPGITVTGEVASPADYIQKATVCVNPMQVGAGMQNKLLEYLAMGKATIATTLANEGIDAMPDRDLLIADTPKDFARGIIELLGDPARRRALGTNARAFVEDRWSWEAQFLQLESVFFDPNADSPVSASIVTS